MNKKLEKIKKDFIKKVNGDYNFESEEIELDNLDKACLVFGLDPKIYKPTDFSIMVENEHGTRFDLDELTESEMDVFLYILNN